MNLPKKKKNDLFFHLQFVFKLISFFINFTKKKENPKEYVYF